MTNINSLWQARKRNALGLPWTFTVYELTEEKLYINIGLFNKTQEEIRLYRILDLTLKRSLWQRMFGMGTIHCCSADKTTPELELINIKDSAGVKELLSQQVEACRERKGISTREFIGGIEDAGLDL